MGKYDKLRKIPKYQDGGNPYINEGAGQAVDTGELKKQFNFNRTLSAPLPIPTKVSPQITKKLPSRYLEDAGNQFKQAGRELWNFAKSPEVIQAGTRIVNDWATSGLEQSSFVKGVTHTGNFLSGIDPTLGAYVGLVSTGLNIIDKLGSSSLKDFNIDTSVLDNVGSGYSGTSHDLVKYSDLTKQNFGLLNRGAYNRAKRLGKRVLPQYAKMQEIADTVSDQKAMVQDFNYYQTRLNGTFDPRYFQAAKNGAKIKDPITLVKERRRNKQVINVNAWKPVIVDVPEFKDGGIIEQEDTWQPVIVDEVEKLEKGRTIQQLIDYAKQQNPRFIQRMSEPVRFIEWEENGEKYKGTHLLGYEFDGNNWYVFPSIQEINGELKRFTDPFEALDSAKKNNNFLIMSKDEAKLFTESGEDKDGNLYGYKAGWPEFFKFQKGGKTEQEKDSQVIETTQKNVIPEGALHAHKHHMDNAEDLTKKGIPVIDNNNNQQAEIERNEIIFSLEVTKKLEELKDKYFSEDSKQKDKDQAAIEAGQLLVQEILFNTEDRTNLINSIEV